MTTLLWLDAIRNPFLNVEGKVPTEYFDIVWALNYEQFTAIIEKFGLPDGISFDHYLADEKTGYDCAKWLCYYCAEKGLPLPRCYVHSVNPVGADNIKNYLNNFVKHQAAERLH